MTNETKQINLLIEVLQAIQENYGASDFLYPQTADEIILILRLRMSRRIL